MTLSDYVYSTLVDAHLLLVVLRQGQLLATSSLRAIAPV